MPSKNRAESSLWHTGRLVAQVEAFEKATKTAATGSGQSAEPLKIDLFRQIANNRQLYSVTNETVVQWLKAGLKKDFITASIRHALNPNFNLSSVEVGKLRREGVDSRIIDAMRSLSTGSRTSTWNEKREFVLISALLLLRCLPALAH